MVVFCCSCTVVCGAHGYNLVARIPEDHGGSVVPRVPSLSPPLGPDRNWGPVLVPSYSKQSASLPPSSNTVSALPLYWLSVFSLKISVQSCRIFIVKFLVVQSLVAYLILWFLFMEEAFFSCR